MPTDPQTLLSQAKCFSCFSPNNYTLDLLQLSLLVKWLNSLSPAPPAGGFKLFTTPDIATNAAALFTFPHGLGQVPPIVLMTARCVVNDANTGLVVGDEISIDQVCWTGSGSGFFPAACVAVDGVNVFGTNGEAFDGKEASSLIWNKTVVNISSAPDAFDKFVLTAYCLLPSGFPSFTKPNVPAGTGVSTSNHGLAATPQLTSAVLKCIANDAASGWQAGWESPASYTGSNGVNDQFTESAQNATKAILSTDSLFAGNEIASEIWVLTGVDNAANMTSCNNFALKSYNFLSTPHFTTPLIAAGAGAQNFAHGLSKRPQIVIPVVVCVAADANTGMAVGDEVPLNCFGDGGPNGPNIASLVGANATNIFTHTQEFAAGNEANLLLWNKAAGTGATAISSVNNFRLKVYAWAI